MKELSISIKTKTTSRGVLYKSDVLPPLIEDGGFPLKKPNDFSINGLSPRVPRLSLFYIKTNNSFIVIQLEGLIIILIPSFLMLTAALWSRLCLTPQFGQIQDLVLSSKSTFRYPHSEHN